MEEDGPNEHILSEASEALGQEGGVVGSFVIVGEVIGPNGSELRMLSNSHIPSWVVEGMLTQALRVVQETV